MANCVGGRADGKWRIPLTKANSLYVRYNFRRRLSLSNTLDVRVNLGIFSAVAVVFVSGLVGGRVC